MNKKLGLLRRINDKLDKNSKIIYYKSIFLPHLDYCSSILFLLNKGQISELQKIQNKFLRLILRAKRDKHVEDMLDELIFLSVDEKIKLNVLTFIFKMEHELAPDYLNEKIIKVNELLNYNTRSGNLVALPKFHTSCSQNSLFYKGVSLYNECI
jgi:hypothetical protein